MFGEEDAIAEQEKKAADPFVWVRVVLLGAAAISAFIAPMIVTFFLGLAWILVMVWPRKS